MSYISRNIVELWTYLLDGLLGLLHLAELDVAEAEELVFGTDRDLAAQDLAVGAELGVEILVVPASVLEAFDED